MKRIVVGTVCASVAILIGYNLYPVEVAQSLNTAVNTAIKVWENIETNPFPVVVALGTFLATVIYHKASGKSLRESVEVAATRVTIVPVPREDGASDEKPVIKRAKARATRAQLLVDQIGLQNRQRKLPDEILKAEKDSCYTQQALTDAQRTLSARQKAHEESVSKLKALRKENAELEGELLEIDSELKKLAEVV
jgi:hypothetical protein